MHVYLRGVHKQKSLQPNALLCSNFNYKSSVKRSSICAWPLLTSHLCKLDVFVEFAMLGALFELTLDVLAFLLHTNVYAKHVSAVC